MHSSNATHWVCCDEPVLSRDKTDMLDDLRVNGMLLETVGRQ
jgi:hypothetical protein